MQIEDLGLVEPVGAVGAGAEAEDYTGPMSPAGRMHQMLSGEIPAQNDVLEFVKQLALDPNAALFRPWLYKKAPVFARRVNKDTTVSVRPKVQYTPVCFPCAFKLQLHFFVFCQATTNPIKFKFVSPTHWVDKNGDPCKEAVSCGDYLSLILEPVVKSDGTESIEQGELYRIEGAAFDNENRFANRFNKVCAQCLKKTGRTGCKCGGGCQPYTHNPP